MALTLLETAMLIANIIFLIIAIFLFVRLRKIGKKGEPEKKQQSEPADIKNITPSEFKPEKFEIKSQDIAPPEKPMAIAPEIQEKTGLKLEDELPEVKEKTAKKESKKKKAAKKVLEEVIEQAIKKETGAPSEKIPIPETKEEPEKKESKKKKPAKKEPEKVVEIKEESKAIPRKKAGQKEKALPHGEIAAKAEKKPSKKKIEKK